MSRHPQRLADYLTHGYFKVDFAIVWRTVGSDLPRLHRQVWALLQDHAGDADRGSTQ